MLPFAVLITGAQAGIWEAAMSLLNSGNGFNFRYRRIVRTIQWPMDSLQLMLSPKLN